MNEKQMQEMAVSILLDEYTQLDVAQLLKEYDEAEENGEVPNVPDTLDEACNRMIQREFSKKKQKKIFVCFSKILSRVAMVTLMLIGLCTVSVLSVEAWRVPALRFVLETFDRYTTVGMEGEGSQESKTPEAVIEELVKSIPNDYNLIYEYTRDGLYLARYLSRNGQQLSLSVSEYRHGVYFDTESTNGTQLQINGYDVIFVNKNGYKALWINEELQLLIEFSTLCVSEDAFWEIAYRLIQ